MLRPVLVGVAVVAAAACSFTPGGLSADDVVDPDGGGGDDDGNPGEDAPGLRLVPSNGAVPLAGADAALVVPAGRVVVVDTDDGAIVSYQGTTPTALRSAGEGVIAGIGFDLYFEKNGGPILGVFTMGSLAIESGTMRITGGTPAVFLVSGAVRVAGELDLGAGRTGPMVATECQACAGPGGGAGFTTQVGATGCAPGLPGTYDLTTDETGGGGGGLGFAGAPGGDSDAPGGGATPVGQCPGAGLEPLRGGSGGGRGGYDPGSARGGSGGGGGGGALQITSQTDLEVAATADLYAGGAGGTGSDTHYGGGGGGAGGALLLEAPTVTIAAGAKITANGGGGGSGRTGSRGENGGRTSTRASGGAGTGPGGGDGRGGLGGVGSGAMGATQGNGLVDGTGGGGGGAGLIRVNTFTPPAIGPGVVISPPLSTGSATSP